MRYRTFRIAILACASAALLTAQALPTGYDPDSEITTVGIVEQVIERVEDGMSSTRAVIVSPIGGNKRYLVELGPASHMDNNLVALQRGDRIEVTGSLKGSKYMDTIIARDVQHGGRTLAVRDLGGQPLWPAGSEQFRAPADMVEERARIDANGTTVEVENDDLDETTRSREMEVTQETTTMRDEGMVTRRSPLPSRIGGPEAVGASGQRAPLADIEERGRAGEAGPVSYNPQTETTISGKVTDVCDATGVATTGKHLVLATDDGRLINVHVGPAGFFSQEQLDRFSGQRVTVIGSRVEANGDQMILARQVSMNGQTWQLRDKAGVPLPPEQR